MSNFKLRFKKRDEMSATLNELMDTHSIHFTVREILNIQKWSDQTYFVDKQIDEVETLLTETRKRVWKIREKELELSRMNM